TAAMSRGFGQLLESVVRIDVREIAFEAGSRRYAASIGSGVILSADGIVLTNAHVASPRAVELNITLSNLERVGAKLVGWDHWTDLAVLRIDMNEVKRRGFKLSAAKFGDSGALYPGQVVFAVGTRFGGLATNAWQLPFNQKRILQLDADHAQELPHGGWARGLAGALVHEAVDYGRERPPRAHAVEIPVNPVRLLFELLHARELEDLGAARTARAARACGLLRAC
ncbi:MAG: hypothetical protein EBS05_26495, partial [Proteobacteria bacterium]|nr:hypothetical protein [Pseudomonadota bacterium]